MKVMHVADSWEGGGAEAVLRTTLKASNDIGFENLLFVSNKKRTPISYIFSVKYFVLLLIKLIVQRPDVIHFQNYYHFLSPSVLLSVRIYKLMSNKIKVIYTAHDYHLICPNSGLEYFLKGERKKVKMEMNNHISPFSYDSRSAFFSLLKYLQHKVSYKLFKFDSAIDVIVSPSYFMRYMLERAGNKKRIVVIRNPNPDFFVNSNAGDDSKIIKQDNEVKGSINIAFAGRLEPEKGICEFISLLKACDSLHVNLNIYGEGRLYDDLARLKKQNQHSQGSNVNVCLHGFLKPEAMPGELIKNDIFVLPSLWYENAPLSIIEAAALGLPVIVPNYGGLLEMAKCTTHSFCFDYDNPVSLKKAVFEAYRSRGCNSVIDSEEFSMKNYKKNIAALYEC